MGAQRRGETVIHTQLYLGCFLLSIWLDRIANELSI
uniref:Uncharacterized protein n=1 Tax=Setaria italica TaxID=4555 RepID=K3YY31_SETIT